MNLILIAVISLGAIALVLAAHSLCSFQEICRV